MIMSDYTKRIYTYLDFPYDKYGDTMSVEEYEKMMLRHLASVKERAIEWSKTQKDLTDIKVNVYMDAEDNHVVAELSLIGQIPMNEEERQRFDEGEKNRLKNIADMEQQQLAHLLKKYPQK